MRNYVSPLETLKKFNNSLFFSERNEKRYLQDLCLYLTTYCTKQERLPVKFKLLLKHWAGIKQIDSVIQMTSDQHPNCSEFHSNSSQTIFKGVHLACLINGCSFCMGF